MSAAEVVTMPTARETREGGVSVLQVLSIAMSALGARAYRWVSLLLVSGAAAYSLWEPSVLRIVTVVVYALLTHVPLWWKDMRTERG
jgi:hypothetical protein